MNIKLKGMLSKTQFKALCTLWALIAFAAPAAAVPTNVVLGKPVTVTGEIGVISAAGLGQGFGDATAYPPAPLSTLVDGVNLPEGTYWQAGTVWWDERNPGSADNIIEIDLNGRFLISWISIQADNNDEYSISYRNPLGVWAVYGYFPAVAGAGMRERAGTLGPFEATALRIDARAGDQFYSVSEFGAMGEAVPEPGSLLLIGVGIAGLGFSRRKRA